MFSNMDADRCSRLFDLALQGQHFPDGDLSDSSAIEGLSPEDREGVEEIRRLLDFVDGAWLTPEVQIDRVRARFLEQLAATEPDHPWVRSSTVETLGDLVQASGEDSPPLPAECYEFLVHDPTPVRLLLDPVERNRYVGQIIRNAGIPVNDLRGWMLWLNRTLAALLPVGRGTQPKLLFTRKQRRTRERR